MNGISDLKLFQLSNGDLLFRSMPTASTKKVRKPRMTKLGQGVEVRAFYPNVLLQVQWSCEMLFAASEISHNIS